MISPNKNVVRRHTIALHLIVLSGLLIPTTLVAAISTDAATADGQSAKQWLSDATSRASEVSKPDDIAVVRLMDSIAQCQVTLGDVVGASHTVDWMEKHVASEHGNMYQELDLLYVFSAEIGAGRIGRAQTAINVFAGVNNPTGGYKRAMVAVDLARLGANGRGYIEYQSRLWPECWY